MTLAPCNCNNHKCIPRDDFSPTIQLKCISNFMLANQVVLSKAKGRLKFPKTLYMSVNICALGQFFWNEQKKHTALL